MSAEYVVVQLLSKAPFGGLSTAAPYADVHLLLGQPLGAQNSGSTVATSPAVNVAAPRGLEPERSLPCPAAAATAPR